MGATTETRGRRVEGKARDATDTEGRRGER